jgi:3-hydroxyisobutyrate dehydrogenase-like beta-hydroxyacid dehydrogenase/gamma-glutamylcyclotransferase (GGCT)/AIG2-like uncharacterized protein YtfP
MPLLFSYGTLQQENVQISTFGRQLRGQQDELVGYEQSSIRIEDPDIVAASGKTDHPIVKFTGSRESRVTGTVFDITDEELACADRYEVSSYKRVSTRLASGSRAWVYVDARFAPQEAVAIIGLGSMGHAMAHNLLACGIPISVWNRTASKADDLVSVGATRASSIAEVGAADIVITMVSDDGALKETLFTGGLIDALRPGSIHVSMSTISVALAEQLAAEHERRGSALVCAPVVGRPDAAAAARLFVLAAGDAAAVDRCQPAFDAIGQRTFRLGREPKAAVVVKLSVNFLIAALIESLSEASVLVKKHDVSPHALVDLLTSTLFAAPAYRTYGAIIADERYRPAGFPAPLGLKDMSLVLDAARGANAPMPLASLIRDHLIAAIALGYGDADWSAFGAIAAHNAGLHR